MEKIAALNIKRKRVDELIPHPLNPRFHPDSQIEKIVYWLSKLGYYKSIVVQKGTNYMLAGHSVLDGLKAKNYTQVDVSEVDHPDKWAMALMAWDNKSGELSNYDQVNLIAVKAELHEMGVEMESMGFEMGEIDAMGSNVKIKEDDPPPVSEDEPITQMGDLWTLGEHRVLCGDSTKVEDVERLMDGERADMVFTDPPYGVKRDKGFDGFDGFDGFGGFGVPIARRQYQDDWDSDRPSKECFDGLISLAEVVLIFGGNYFADLLPRSTHWLVWDKLNTMPTFGDCELIWTNSDRKSVKKITFEYNGLIGKERARLHPTQKPVGLLAEIIEEYDGQIIIDPFLGSGTTLMACEGLGRKCVGLEILPKYCDVVVKRYINHVNTAEKVFVERDGERLSWSEVQKPARVAAHVC